MDSPRRNPAIFQSSIYRVRSNRRIVCRLLEEGHDILRYVAGGLQNDAAIVMAAVQHRPHTYLYSHPDSAAREDLTLALHVVGVDPSLAEFVGPTLRKKIQFGLEALKKNPMVYEHLADELKQDRDIILAVVPTRPEVLFDIKSELYEDDHEIILAAVTRDGFYLDFASLRLRDDPEIVSRSVGRYFEPLRWASERLMQDWNFLLDIMPHSHKWRLIWVDHRSRRKSSISKLQTAMLVLIMSWSFRLQRSKYL